MFEDTFQEYKERILGLLWHVKVTLSCIFVTDFQDKFYPEVLGGVFVTYLFLQTFAIPGSIFLSIVSGYLFRFPVALLLICFCSATGASFCYLLSYLAGKPLVHKYLPER